MTTTPRIILTGFLMLVTGSVGATDRLSMRVSPSFAFAPANLIVRATIEANRNNRAIEVIADSENFYRSSEIQLDGDRAPRVTSLEFRSMPGGLYAVRAVLKGSNGEELASTETHINVVSTGGVLR